MNNEKQNPLLFLVADKFEIKIQKKKKIWIFNNKIKDFKIIGNIINKAQHTIYKNISIQIIFLDKKKKAIQNKKITLKKWFPPNQNNKIEIPLDQYDYQKINNFKIKIITAKIVNGTGSRK